MARPVHPVEEALTKIGTLKLVGSRAFYEYLKFWTPESDFDFHLGFSRKEKYLHEDVRRCHDALVTLGFYRLPGGGPYGRDQLVSDIYRLDAMTIFNTTWPAVDVILMQEAELRRREPIWDAIVRCETRGGQFCRAMKAEQAWGTFWWLTQIPQGQSK